MGFALWIEEYQAVAQGTHEYRPMGAAVIAAGCVFTARDFNRRRRGRSQHFKVSVKRSVALSIPPF